MTGSCTHLGEIRNVKPSAHGCEECLKIGSEWVHLRLCRSCGHVGCCDSSPNRHATKHLFHRRCGHKRSDVVSSVISLRRSAFANSIMQHQDHDLCLAV